MKKIAVLPSLVTLGNLLCGFAAIICASTDVSPLEGGPDFELAAWLIFLGMVFDGLDGRIARMTKQTSGFGTELDSLCDVVTFGVAPAVLVQRLAASCHVFHLPGQVIWLASALFAVCAALRLARFNVTTSPEEEAHDYFQGLPSPAAAGLVAGMVVVNRCFHGDYVVLMLPFVAATAGVLMVTNLRYVHVVNRIMRDNKSFGYIVELVLFLLVITILNPRLTLACGFAAYALTGPAGVLEEYIRLHGPASAERRASAEDRARTP